MLKKCISIMMLFAILLTVVSPVVVRADPTGESSDFSNEISVVPDDAAGDASGDIEITDVPVDGSDEIEIYTLDYQISVNVPNSSFPNVALNLENGLKVTPETDANGDPIAVRLVAVISDIPGFQWNQTNICTFEKDGNYTLYYEATDVSGNVVATLEKTIVVRGSKGIGGQLDGDYAYISEAGLVEDNTTSSGFAIRTGTMPFDDSDTPGNDTNDKNNRMRSFDTAIYTVYFKSKVRDDAPYAAYQTGVLYFEFVLPGTKDEITFNQDDMGWLSAKKNIIYTISEVDDPELGVCQVLSGNYLWEPSDENPNAIGESYQELNIATQALAMKEGDVVKPYFTFWLDFNEVPETGLVTTNKKDCSVHTECEPKTIDVPGIDITSELRLNVNLMPSNHQQNNGVGVFDFATGDDTAQFKERGKVEGRMLDIAVMLEIRGKTMAHGLRGCEIPDGSDISFDIDLTSYFDGDDGVDYTDGGYDLLLWAVDENAYDRVKHNGRRIGTDSAAVIYAPANKGSSKVYHCYDGGSWDGYMEGNTIHMTCSNYTVNLNHLPYTWLGSRTEYYEYYNPNTIDGYWAISEAVFSVGSFFLVQPFDNADGEYVVDKYGTSGSFQMIATDRNMDIASDAQIIPKDPDGNSNQAYQRDDRIVKNNWLSNPGTISTNIHYSENPPEWDVSLTPGCLYNGEDWVRMGDQVGIYYATYMNSNEGMYSTVAEDMFLKFDDRMFEIHGAAYVWASGSGERRVGFVAKHDKTGWDHHGKNPGDEGYDDEMRQSHIEDMVIYPTLQELLDDGAVCVGVYGEVRVSFDHSQKSNGISVEGRCKVDPDLVNNVFMITHEERVWNKGNLLEGATEYLGHEPQSTAEYNKYMKEVFPSRFKNQDLDYGVDYPKPIFQQDNDITNGLKNYEKSYYNETGYAGGSSGTVFADSCLVVGYSTQIQKKTIQKSGNVEKRAYDMDSSQRVADYILEPSIRRTDGIENETEGSFTTDVFIEDTLPNGLTYIPNSSYWGGTYNQVDEGKQGIVTGGIQIEPEIITKSDGKMVLKWTLRNVTISTDRQLRIDPIYYSCDIGTPGNEKTDVKNNDSLENVVTIRSAGEPALEFNEEAGNMAKFSILVSKNNAVSISKITDQKVVDVGKPMGFHMNVGNNSANTSRIIAVDSFPYSGDEAGSSFDGDCIVTEFSILNPDLWNNMKVYYTDDINERGKISENYQYDEFGTNPLWKPLTVHADTGVVNVPADFKPVAVAVVGELPGKNVLKLHTTLVLPDGKPGSYVVNKLTQKDLMAQARSYVVSRILDGVVWMDDNRNGLRGNKEPVVDNVNVQLMRLKDGGDPKNPDDYVLYDNAVVQTGYQYDIYTHESTPYIEGHYRFINLPQGIYNVRFDNQKFNMSGYLGSPKDIGTDDTIDSDAAFQTDALGAVLRGDIVNISMPHAEDIQSLVYTSSHHDLGLCSKNGFVQIYKYSDNKHVTDGNPEYSMKGAQYAIYRDEACTDKVAVLEINEKGYSDKLEIQIGPYWVKEIKAPANFALDTQVHQIEVIPEHTVEKPCLLGVEEHALIGSVSVSKIDDTVPLTGVEFGIYDATGMECAVGTTDDTGRIEFTGLVPGKYELKELKTVDGYMLLKDPVYFTIPMSLTKAEMEERNADASKFTYNEKTGLYDTYELTFEVNNHRTFDVPVTGGRPGFYQINMLAGGLILLAILCVPHRKRNDEIK